MSSIFVLVFPQLSTLLQVVYKPYMAAFLDDVAAAKKAWHRSSSCAPAGGDQPEQAADAAAKGAAAAGASDSWSASEAARMPAWVEAILAALPAGEDIQLGEKAVDATHSKLWI